MELKQNVLQLNEKVSLVVVSDLCCNFCVGQEGKKISAIGRQASMNSFMIFPLIENFLFCEIV
jgi:hypothetical protein